jgi:hypothetical protein
MSRENPHQKYKFWQLADKFNTLQAKITLLKQENAKIRARKDTRVSTKKKQAMPNPNKKFISIHNILSKGGCVKDLKEGIKPQEESKPAETIIIKEQEDIYRVSNNKENEEVKEGIPAEVQTRSGRKISRPTRYSD